ncbi:uncharacterized protein BYT42DRAFT_545370 [Radiomyces spectabilis]|uniref:uncharacterized protein n=1 Tax=Radiomyces spectabilis TaxID=64574 RepID=UPI00221F2211|nr:uncharacterized protein BYT42DRAFT_545370 [Radiomyces spectabilis]KAI8381490.1 hypothetical protein BYT42DRAFT_545370 [Radiomyces spectabilis]
MLSLTLNRNFSTAPSQPSFPVPDVPPTVAFVKRKRDGVEVDRDEMVYRQIKKRKRFRQVVFPSTLQIIHFNFMNELEDEELRSKKWARYEGRPGAEEDIEMPLWEREEGAVSVAPAWPALVIAQIPAQANFTDVAVKNDWPEEAPARVSTQLAAKEKTKKKKVRFLPSDRRSQDPRLLAPVSGEAMPEEDCLPEPSPDDMEMAVVLAKLLYGLTLVERDEEGTSLPQAPQDTQEDQSPTPRSDPPTPEPELEDQIHGNLRSGAIGSTAGANVCAKHVNWRVQPNHLPEKTRKWWHGPSLTSG